VIDLKAGVKLTHLTPAIAWAIFRMHEVYLANGIAVLTITSADDYDHGQKGVPDEIDPKTLHGKGKAVDVRTHDIPRNRLDELVAEVRAKLGRDFEVLIEGRGMPSEHLHCEWQPFGGI
jgi:hypothetical protein